MSLAYVHIYYDILLPFVLIIYYYYNIIYIIIIKLLFTGIIEIIIIIKNKCQSLSKLLLINNKRIFESYLY